MFTYDQYKSAADTLGCEPEIVEAVVLQEVGDKSSTFTSGGKTRLKILFERHVFWRELEARDVDPRELLRRDPSLADILSQQPYGKYGTFAAQYQRRDRAAGISRDAALAACSYSAFQIMGNNFKSAGFESVAAFVEAMELCDTETYLGAFVSLCKAEGLDKFLRVRDFESFARHYNGPGYYKRGYHISLAKHYQRIIARTLPRHESKLKAVVQSGTLQRGAAIVATGAAPAAALLPESDNLAGVLETVKTLADQGNAIKDQVGDLQAQAAQLAPVLDWLPWAAGGWTVLLVLIFAALVHRYLRDRGYIQ
jgi:hypothetical protein